MEFDKIHIFVKIVQFGSFRKAARFLNMLSSTVRTKIAALEKKLGHITLLQRTTRQVHLTERGKIYYPRCLRAMKELSIAEEELAANNPEPQDVLRIVTTIAESHSFIAPVLSQFMDKYPKIRIDIDHQSGC